MIPCGKKQGDVLSTKLVPVFLLQDITVVPTSLNVLAIMLFLSKYAVGRAHVIVRGASGAATTEDNDDDGEQQRDP